MDVGIIGLGVLGRAVAERFLRLRMHSVYVYAHAGCAADLIAKRALACATPRLVAENSAIVFLTCDDHPSLERCSQEHGGLKGHLREDQVVVWLSSRWGDRRTEAVGLPPICSTQMELVADAKDSGAPTFRVRGSERLYCHYEPCFRQLGPDIRFEGPLVAGIGGPPNGSSDDLIFGDPGHGRRRLKCLAAL
jgi:2-hydroxy-3-oxopropionate reductase